MNKREKDASIDYILSQGLVKPLTMRESLSEIYRTLGLRNIFFDVSQAFALTAVVMVGVVMLAAVLVRHYVEYAHAPAFAMSPLLFVCLTLFTELAELVDGLYELKMTVKYTLHQVTAFRVLFFSLPGMLFSVLISIAFSLNAGVYQFFSVLSLSLCSLFLYAFLTGFILRRFPHRWYSLAVLWMAFSILPQFIFGVAWEHFLSQLPVVVSLGFAALACVLYLLGLKKMLNRSNNYAYSQ